MPALHHVYLTAHGTYTTAEWDGENAQMGLRMPFAPVVGAPDKGTTFTPASNGDIVPDSGMTAGTHGTLTRTWTARVGLVGSQENMNAAEQIDMFEDLWTYLNTIKTYQHNIWRWTEFRMAAVLEGGKYGAPASVYTLATPLTGVGTVMESPQVAMCVSMRAPILGRRGRGRMYIPGVGGSNLSNGTIASATRTGITAATKTLIDNLQAMSGWNTYLPIVSVMSGTSTTAVRPSQVRMGNHFDIQRRRIGQTPETYTDLAL